MILTGRFPTHRSKKGCTLVPNAWGRLKDIHSDSDSERFAVTCQRSDELSNAGFAFGYFAGVVGLIISIPLILFMTNTQSNLENKTDTLGYRCVWVGGWVGGWVCLDHFCDTCGPDPSYPACTGADQNLTLVL